MVECDPTRRGYTPIPNYVKHFWTPLMGLKAATVYEMLCSFAHGDKEECHPTVGLLAATLRVDKHDLTGRKRRDRRPGRTSEYYQPGMFEVLEDYGLLRITIEPGRWKQRYTFNIVKYPPLLSADQLAQLPTLVQERHRRLLVRCQKDQEKWLSAGERRPRHDGKKDVVASSVTLDPVGDAATEQWVTPPPSVGDAAIGDLNIQGTIQLNTLATTLPADMPAAEESVKTFYQQIGQSQVSRQKIKAGVKTVADLKSQGFKLVDILWVMMWITTHQEQFGGAVYSLGLLPLVIGQALASRKSEQKQPTNHTQHAQADRQRQTDLKRQQELEHLYQALASTEQAALREVAVKGLLEQGVKKQHLLDGLVKSEVCRLLASKTVLVPMAISGNTPVCRENQLTQETSEETTHANIAPKTITG